MKKERAFWGILFIVAAIALIIGKLFVFAINVFSIIITVFLIIFIIKSIPTKNFAGILFPIAFICIIFDKKLGITEITPWIVLIAAMLGTIGLSIIFPKTKNYNLDKFESYDFENISTESEGYININTSFGENIKYINTDKFERSNLKCHFGTIKIYFDGAHILNNRGVVNIDASFAGIELYVPKTWNIENRIHSIFGGVDIKTRSLGTSNNTLILTGNLSFAGVNIIYI
ncbi:LiaF transmembrane domain-containing protein [Intestinibacter sp.]